MQKVLPHFKYEFNMTLYNKNFDSNIDTNCLKIKVNVICWMILKWKFCNRMALKISQF